MKSWGSNNPFRKRIEARAAGHATHPPSLAAVIANSSHISIGDNATMTSIAGDNNTYYQQGLTAENEDILRKMVVNISSIATGLDENRRKKILDWISSLTYQDAHSRHKNESMEGSGQWLLESDEYTEWKNVESDENSSVLLLHGDPGTGKSTLASIIINDLVEGFKAKHHPHPAYFYCVRQADSTTTDPKQVLASIARQLSAALGNEKLLKPAEIEHQQTHDPNSSKQLDPSRVRSLLSELVNVLAVSYIVTV